MARPTARFCASRARALSGLKLTSAVISRLEERPMAPGDLHAALLDRAGRWVAPGVVAGFAERVDGFATTTSTDFNVLALGRRPEAMAQAVNRVLDLHAASSSSTATASRTSCRCRSAAS